MFSSTVEKHVIQGSAHSSRKHWIFNHQVSRHNIPEHPVLKMRLSLRVERAISLSSFCPQSDLDTSFLVLSYTHQSSGSSSTRFVLCSAVCFSLLDILLIEEIIAEAAGISESVNLLVLTREKRVVWNSGLPLTKMSAG